MIPQEQPIADRKAAEDGDAAAQCRLARAYETGNGVEQNEAEAFKWYSRSAAQGYAHAQFCVGFYYHHGKGVAKDDVQAAKYYAQATENGNQFAPFYLGEMYVDGSGVAKDETKAAHFYRIAADRDNPDAQFKLGWIYSNGVGVTKDYLEALKWYHKAAEHGNAAAENNLGWLYEDGIGVFKDTTKAIYWYRRAAKRGSKKAQENLNRLNIPIEQEAAEPPPVSAKNQNWNHPAGPEKASGESADCKPLLAACTPLVYVHNAFRITGLPVDASTRDFKRRVDDLKAAAEMGDDDDEHTHAFALKSPPEIDHIREAAQRLDDPERRIIEELFWFWPQEAGQGASDRALGTLRSGDKDAAFKLWSAASQHDDPSESITAKHNLAVMYQMVALDSELLALKGEFSAEQTATISNYWTTCLRWWDQLADDETFWSIVTDRIRTLDDHRLTTGFARRMRATLPIALQHINAMLALQFAEKGKYDHAKRHIAYMKQLNQGSDDVERVIGDILKPLETRVNDAVEKAAAKAKRDATAGAGIAKELLEITKQPLATIRSLLDEDQAIRFYLFELVYDACSTCLIAYGNKTEDWPTCVALLKITEPLAVTDEARSKIRTNIAQAEENQRQKMLYEICWFCKNNKAEDTHVLEVPMHGNVERHWRIGGTRITWRTLTAKVPRCPTCKEAHSKVAGKWTGAAAGAAVGTAIMPVIGSAIGFFAGKAIGRLVDQKMRLPDGVQAESAKATYPPIQKLINEGWAFGEKPSS
jgi:hypothetical protein